MAETSEHALVRRLRSIFALTDADAEAVATLPVTVRDFGADQDIVRAGDRPTQSFMIQEGVTAMYKITGPGRRQILGFFIPGDMPDLHSLHLPVMDSSIATLTPCRIAFIQHDVVKDICRQRPAVSDAFWKMTLVDAAVSREWIVNIGQRNASIRLAHLLCEMFLRFKAVGLANLDTCEFPITQQELADATGISVVHVNRMLQELRGQGLISLSQRKLAALDLDSLRRAGDFDATYLHLLPDR